MLRFNLKPIFAARGIDKPNGYLRKHGFNSNMASRIVTGNLKELNFNKVEVLCMILNCTPHDFLEWVPDASVTEPSKFELSALVKEKNVMVLSKELKGLPLAKIKEVYSFIEEKRKESMQ